MQEFAAYINGQWQQGQGALLNSINPANNALIWQAPSASSAEVNAAVMAARHAQQNWARLPFAQRLHYLEAFIRELDAQQDALAQVISEETGKVLWECHSEVSAALAKLEVSVVSYHQRSDEQQHAQGSTKLVLRHKPHGVVAVFAPFNFPLHLPCGHIIPALLAGNTVVLKASEYCPLSSQHMMQIWQRAGLPDGVINLVQGGKECGLALASHAQLDGLFFTGSSQVGAQLAKHFATQPQKILALEMGGNNPLVIGSEINDINAAVYIILMSAFLTTGQRCSCARRLIVPQGEMGDALLNKLIAHTQALHQAPLNLNPSRFMGSMISAQAASNMQRAQAHLQSLGGCSLVELEHCERELGFVHPGIIDVSAIEQCPDEEYFGPLLQVIRYQHWQEAIDIANRTRFGLSAGLLSDSQAQWNAFYQQSRAGIVNWNQALTGASSRAPFGGIGASGNHRPSAFYAADYCAYPVASMENTQVQLPSSLPPGLNL